MKQFLSELGEAFSYLLSAFSVFGIINCAVYCDAVTDGRLVPHSGLTMMVVLLWAFLSVGWLWYRSDLKDRRERARKR